MAEDDPINQKLAVATLELRGYEIVVVDNGRQAVEKIKQNPEAFNLILMDIQMPEMDGYEATRTLRALEKSRGCEPLPIIAMTAHAFKQDKEKCLKGGMDDYISKPIDSEKLFAIIAKYTG